MVSEKTREKKVKYALSQLENSRSQRAVFPIALAFHHRYVSRKLLRLDIATFVQLITRLKSSQLLDVVNGPPHLISELKGRGTDFKTKWYNVFKQSQNDVQAQRWSSPFLLEVATFFFLLDSAHPVAELARGLVEGLATLNKNGDKKRPHSLSAGEPIWKETVSVLGLLSSGMELTQFDRGEQRKRQRQGSSEQWLE